MPVTDPSVPAALSKLLGDDRIAVHLSCDFAHHAGLVAKSQATTDGVNNHGTDAYYTDRKSLFNYIVPGTIVHEALHNLTGKTDDELRSDILFIPQPGSNGTFDITQKVEDIGCAPKVKK